MMRCRFVSTTFDTFSPQLVDAIRKENNAGKRLQERSSKDEFTPRYITAFLHHDLSIQTCKPISPSRLHHSWQRNTIIYLPLETALESQHRSAIHGPYVRLETLKHIGGRIRDTVLERPSLLRHGALRWSRSPGLPTGASVRASHAISGRFLVERRGVRS